MSYPQPDARPAIIARANEIAEKHLQHRAANPLPRPLTIYADTVLRSLNDGRTWTVIENDTRLGIVFMEANDDETERTESLSDLHTGSWAVHYQPSAIERWRGRNIWFIAGIVFTLFWFLSGRAVDLFGGGGR